MGANGVNCGVGGESGFGVVLVLDGGRLGVDGEVNVGIGSWCA